MKKPAEFRGRSLGDLRAFPSDVRREAGHQIDRIQEGLEPDDWKPMPAIGSGAREIRINDTGDQYRVIYVAKFEDAIYVLHSFQKKTQATRKQDIDHAKAMYQDVVREIQQWKENATRVSGMPSRTRQPKPKT